VRLGVNVPNFGPGTSPDMLRRWALTVEGLGFDLLMVSDHIAVTADVAGQYPAPFYEPFTTLSWLAGLTRTVRLGTTVLIVPYRHPLLTARMAANLNDLSGGRLVLGVGVGWARQEFDALGVAFGKRGRLTDEYLLAIRAAWRDEATGRLKAAAADQQRPEPALVPRIALQLTDSPVTGEDRLAGHGTIGQITADLEQLRLLGAGTVVLDPFNGDPRETARPQPAWRALAAVADRWTP
jgi:alkanesulfonate monooxygenase SsuD/methylene tetrahydromethanopterin reductase-like flavin-dependent oxidoreductase (luciferase family)